MRFREANSRGLVFVLQAVQLLKGWMWRKCTGAGQGHMEVTAVLAGRGTWVPASSTPPGCSIHQVLPLRVGLSEGFRMRPSRAVAGPGET